MAIQFYIGAEGSGKTYQVVTVACREALKQGRRVFTNIPEVNAEAIIQDIKDRDFSSDSDFDSLVFGTVEYFRSHEIHDDPKFYPDLSDRNFVVMSDLGDLKQYRVQPGDLFVIDECFEVYHRERKLPLHDETFFRKHRKYVHHDTKLSTEIIIMTQDKDACNKHLLSTVTFTYEATKKEEIGQPNRFNIDIYKGKPKYRDKPIKQLLLQEYDKDKFHWYKSHAEEGARQESVDTRQNALNKKRIFFMLSFPVLFIILLVILYFRFTKGKEHDESAEDQLAASTNSSMVSGNTPSKGLSKLSTPFQKDNAEAEQELYITGVIEKGMSITFYLSDGIITKTIQNPDHYYKWGRTYNLEHNGKWYTNYSYSYLLQSRK